MKSKLVITLIIMILLSGCISNSGEGITNYESPEAQVNESAINHTGYKYNETREISYNKSINASITKINVSVDSYFTIYNRDNNGTFVPRSTYGALSTPSVSPSDVELNPVVVDPADNIVNEINKDFNDYSLKLQENINSTNITNKKHGNTTVKTYNSSIIVEEADASINSRIMTSVIDTNRSVLISFVVYPTAAQDNSNQQEYALDMIRNTYIPNKSETDNRTNNTETSS